MAKQVPWSKLIVEEFVTLACLTPIEEQILRTRVRGMTRIQQAEIFNISLSTLDRHIATLKKKYDQVEKYSPLLPPRKTSACEEFLDNN